MYITIVIVAVVVILVIALLAPVWRMPNRLIAVLETAATSPKRTLDDDFDRNNVRVYGAPVLRLRLWMDKRFYVTNHGSGSDWWFSVNAGNVPNWPDRRSYDVHDGMAKFLATKGYDATHYFSAD